MAGKSSEPVDQRSLRLRALSHLTGQEEPPAARLNASGALAVLHELAASPLTASASLKLLHELQVHQVELDIQEEELRRAIGDLEGALFRQVQLHDFAPAGLFEVARSTELFGLNRTGAQWLGFERDALIGRTLDSFLEPGSSHVLHEALTRVADGAEVDGCVLKFTGRDGVSRSAHASLGPDPAGRAFLIACVEIRSSGGGASD